MCCQPCHAWIVTSGHNSKMGKLRVNLSLHADSISERRLTMGLMSADAGRPVVKPGNKRGRPSNLARQAAAAAAAAAAHSRDGDQASPSRSQSANPAADRDGLSQVSMSLPIILHLCLGQVLQVHKSLFPFFLGSSKSLVHILQCTLQCAWPCLEQQQGHQTGSVC